MEEKEVKFIEEEIKNFKIIIEKLNKIIKQLDSISEILNPIIDNVSIWLSGTTFSKSQFILLLQKKLGYSYHDAKKIAWKYYIQEGKYTLEHYLIEKKKKEEMDNVVKH